MRQIKKCISMSFKTEFNAVPHHLSSITVTGRATLHIPNQRSLQRCFATQLLTREGPVSVLCHIQSPLNDCKSFTHAASVTCRWAALSCWESSAGSELGHSEKAASVFLLFMLLFCCLFDYKINILLGVHTAADAGKIKAHCPDCPELPGPFSLKMRNEIKE